MIEYVIFINDLLKITARWEKHLLIVHTEGKYGNESSVLLTHDQAKKLAAFIMAQVKEEK